MSASRKQWKLFQRTLSLFFGLGVVPLLIVAIAFALPLHLQFTQYRLIIGILLIVSTVSTLCLAGIVVKILKQPILMMIDAQKAISEGNLDYRLPIDGSIEMQNMFEGFNNMAAALAIATENEKRMAEERSLTKVASQVVHDIRSPLATLNVVAHYFNKKQSNDEEFQGFTKLLQTSIERLRNIAEDLLNRRKNESSQTPTLLHDAIDSLITEFRSRFTRDLQFVTEYHHPTIPVSATKNELQRAFGNIFTNAIEAMQSTGTITIKTDSSDIGVRIRVQDNGPGMTAEILQKVLKGGFTYGKTNGNGVGMTVVREIVEKYKGKLDGASSVGLGTTFLIDLPLYAHTS